MEDCLKEVEERGENHVQLPGDGKGQKEKADFCHLNVWPAFEEIRQVLQQQGKAIEIRGETLPCSLMISPSENPSLFEFVYTVDVEPTGQCNASWWYLPCDGGHIKDGNDIIGQALHHVTGEDVGIDFMEKYAKVRVLI